MTVITTVLLLLHPFNGLFSRTTWLSRYQKGKTSLDLNEAFDPDRWPHQHLITLIFKGQMLFLTPNQQCQRLKAHYITEIKKKDIFDCHLSITNQISSYLSKLGSSQEYTSLITTMFSYDLAFISYSFYRCALCNKYTVFSTLGLGSVMAQWYHGLLVSLYCLQCFDAVGWAAGRASGL